MSDQDRIDQLEAKVKELTEAKVKELLEKTLEGVAFFVVATLGAAWFFGWGAFFVGDSLQVRELVIVNGKGQELVKLTANVADAGALITYNGKGQELVRLTATVDGEGMLTTYNGNGQKLVTLGVGLGSGEGMLVTYNGKGEIIRTVR